MSSVLSIGKDIVSCRGEESLEVLYNQAHACYLPIIQSASRRYLVGGVMSMRIQPEDMEQDLCLLLWEFVKKLDEGERVDSDSFRKRFVWLMWKRIGRAINGQKQGKRNVENDIYVDSYEDVSAFGFSLGDVCDELVYNDYVDEICGRLDEVDQRIFRDMLEPCKDCMRMVSRLVEERGVRMNVNLRGIPMRWLCLAHQTLYGVSRRRFYEGVLSVKRETLVVLGIEDVAEFGRVEF